MVAFAVALAFAVSTYALYQVWQVTGILEGLATCLFLSSLYFFVSSLVHKKRAHLWLAIGLWGACCFTHERYLAFFPVVALAAVLWPVGEETTFLRRLRTAAPAIATALGIAILNVGYKKVVGGGAFLVGTGGTAIDFDVARIAGFLLAGLGNVFGFNIGPSYLSGESFEFAPMWVVAVSSFTAALIAIPCLTWAAASRIWTRPRDLLLVGLWGSAFGVALLTASITIRQEFRWLLAPLTLLLLANAFSMARLPWAAARIAVAVLFASSAVAHAAYYRSRDENVFFIRGQRETDHAYDLLAKYPARLDTLYLLVESERDQCGWFYMNGEWFKVYMPKPPAHFECVSNLEELHGKTLGNDDLVVSAKSSTGEVRDVTTAVRDLLAAEDTDVVTLVDLYDAFGAARLNSDVAVSTPSGKGAFTADAWPTALGTVRAVVLITGFNATYPAQRVRTGERLTFRVGMPFASKVPALAWVDVISDDGRKRVWAQSLTPPADGVTNLVSVSQSLDAYAGRQVQLVLGLDTPTGDSSGHWAVFGEPRIVERAP